MAESGENNRRLVINISPSTENLRLSNSTVVFSSLKIKFEM
jgi:hypothetical protein